MKLGYFNVNRCLYLICSNRLLLLISPLIILKSELLVNIYYYNNSMEILLIYTFENIVKSVK